MTTPAPSGGRSPLRVGGLSLIGVAVIAAVVGLATLATNGVPDTTRTAAPSPAPPGPTGSGGTPPLAAPPATSAPAEDSEVPVPSFSPPPAEGSAPPAPAPGGAPAPGTPGEPAPGASAPGAAQAPGGNGGSGGSGSSGSSGGGGTDRVASGGGGAPATPRAPLRVYNNSRIEGLAAGAAEDFRKAGWVVTDVGAYGSGIIPVTTVYYRPGTDEEAPAKELGREFGLRVMPRFQGIQDASPGVIVIVTREYADKQHSS